MRVATLCVLAGCGFTPTTGTIARDGAPPILDAPADAPADAQPAGLIAYYPMDELPMEDATGHGHDGTCTACPNAVGSGQVDKAYSFNMDRVDVPSAADLRTETGTIAAWVVFDALPVAYACPFGMVYNTIPNGNTWQLCLRDSTQWAVFMQTQAGAVSFTAATNVLTGAWHHMAITWSTTSATLYADGVAISSDLIMPLVYDQGILTIGADKLTDGTVDVPMRGRLDEVKLFDRALTPQEIQALMTH
jgi:Concanavalin A-like lectin/glucanases superfamily